MKESAWGVLERLAGSVDVGKSVEERLGEAEWALRETRERLRVVEEKLLGMDQLVMAVERVRMTCEKTKRQMLKRFTEGWV